ncbi:HpcH/HpaI aldolase family protein [Labrys wisconsinensis]|uniref:4-hydroxy-2-oxoheptanedioate aldolase n=1 Tax=Labrys wisconsinensis TaxID=425677 RepID=A0ABU0J8K0_9HYPH|nr:aldolase/citrate lyase family protein [Labrys wisconsinensis]MDQ0470606.1 4-hydroxy-2-oxoheptanedioate aldolase [Labrys wisconsinensis]
MRTNGLRAVWNEGRYALNAWLSIGSSYSAEVLAHLPYDAVTVDLQHGMFDFETALAMLQAISTTDAVPLVRVPENAAWLIQKVLDMGAYGVICPMIDTREACEAFVQAVRYPPLGKRSFGPARGLLYGGGDYAARANETVLSWAMIETETALANLDAIASVEGLSGLYIGPSDLSMTLEGEVASPLSPRVVREVGRIAAVAHGHGLRVGTFCPDVAFARDMVALGCDLMTVMNDAGLLRKATGALMEELHFARSGRQLVDAP